MTLPSKKGYIEIGLLPKNDSFITVFMIVVGRSFFFLNDVEAASMFIRIRWNSAFANITGEEEYNEEAIGAFDGRFELNEYGNEYEIMFVNAKNEQASVAFLSYGDIVDILQKEPFINDQMLRVNKSIDDYNDKLWDLLNGGRTNLMGNPHIEAFLLNEAKRCGLAAEMVENHLNFFKQALENFLNNQ